MIFPISFSIPECKIIDKVRTKEKMFAHIIPGNGSTYIFSNENDYYDDYAKSVFGRTQKKAGWDCLRHYEILASGCIPFFPHIETCPPQIMTHFPKDIVQKAMKEIHVDSNVNDESIIKVCEELLEYTRNHLTTKVMAKYILEKSLYPNAQKILFLSGQLNPDYLRCLTLHGFKDLFKDNCHDFPRIPHLYSDFPNPLSVYGKGFSYTCTLDPSFHIHRELEEIQKNIETHFYDVVIYGSIHRGTPLWDLVHQYYQKKEIVLLCGEDCDWGSNVHACPFENNVDYNVFIRELK